MQPPADALPGRGGLKVALQPKLAEGLPGVKDWFALYPFACLEQKTSKSVGLRDGKVTFANGLPARTFFGTIYQNVMEGMFADPIYGGNRNKAGWKMLGYPGVSTNNRQNIVRFKNLPFKVDPTSIADVS